MYRDYMEKEAEYKYKAVYILLAIIFLINCGVSIWEMRQISKLQIQQNRIEIIQYNYENLTENTKDYIVGLMDELKIINDEAINILRDVVLSALAGIITTALTLIPMNFLKAIFKSVYSTQYYSNTIEKIIVVETFLVGISFISEICAAVSNICVYQDLFKLYEKVLLTLNNVLLTIPTF